MLYKIKTGSKSSEDRAKGGKEKHTNEPDCHLRLNLTRLVTVLMKGIMDWNSEHPKSIIVLTGLHVLSYLILTTLDAQKNNVSCLKSLASSHESREYEH